MGAPLRIRAAGAGDEEGIARVHVESWRAAYAGIVDADFLAGIVPERRVALWRSILAKGEGHGVSVAETDGRIVGVVSSGRGRGDTTRDASAGEVYALYATRPHWGSGVGRALLSAALGELSAAGFREAFLWVLEANARARRFYEKEGFRPDGGWKRVAIGARELPEVRYRRPL